MMTLLDAFELVAHSEQLLRRLEAAAAELSKKPGLKDEKLWLDQAIAKLSAAREGVGDLQVRVLRLPDLEAVKEDQARVLQNAAVDAIERLQSGIAFAGGPRAPLIEALFGKLKTPVLRRCDQVDFEKFCTDFEKRLNTTYAKRMFADPTYEVVLPVLATMRAAFTTWRSVFSTETLSDQHTQALRDELDAVGRKLELPCRQSRLLGQAALAPLKELAERTQVSQKPKRRGSKADDDEHPMLEEDPVDPGAPNADELRELTV